MRPRSAPVAARVDDLGAFRKLRETGDREVRNQIIEFHAPYALSLARRFGQRGEPLDDLRQVALLGLLKAVERFDPDRGIPFHAFAKPTILGELRRYFRDKGWCMRVPRALQELRIDANDLVAELSQKLGRSPTVADIARAAGVSEDEVILAMESGHYYSPDSLDHERSDDGDDGGPTRRSDLVGERDPQFEGAEDRDDVMRMLRCLPERDRTVVYLRFYEDMTQTEIAQRLGISQMHVSRLLTRSLDRMKAELPDQGRNR
jgi:RNA polymerase sigma-B factor